MRTDTVRSSSVLADDDHRRLNTDLHLYTTDDRVGAGLPLWLPAGTRIRDALESYVREIERRAGYEQVHTPAVAKRSLYERSGHWAHYAADMFPPMSSGEGPSADPGEDLVLRPMGCPHHALIYAAQSRSWRELPLRLAERASLYRDERSGVLNGLSRVRAMDLPDGHVFTSADDAVSEVSAICDLIEEIYRVMGITGHRYRLSLRDGSAKFVDAPEAWRRTEGVLREVLTERGVPFLEARGEAALYGPKIDIQVGVVGVSGAGPEAQEETLSTVQLDAITPARFALTYAGADGRPAIPWMIHRGLVSTAERMVAHLVERHGGALPPWLAPYQAVVLPITGAHEDGARRIAAQLFSAGLHAEVDGAERSLGKRLHAARGRRVCWAVIIGDAEQAEDAVTVRFRDGTQAERIPNHEAVSRMLDVVRERRQDAW